MSQGIYNPFFQNGAYWYGQGGSDSSVDYDGLPDQILQSLVEKIDAVKNYPGLIDFSRFDLNTEANAKTWIKGVVGSDLTLVASDWFKYDGFQTRGVSGSYVRTGIIANDFASLNNFGIAVDLKEARSTNAIVLGVLEATSNRQILLSETTGSFVRYLMSGTTSDTNASDTGFVDYNIYGVERSGATAMSLVKNGSIVETNALAAGGLAQIELYLFARNNQGTADLFAEGRARGMYLYEPNGFNHAGFIPVWNELSDAIDDLIPYLMVVLDMGESDSVGRAEINRLAEPTLNPVSYIASPVGLKLFYKTSHDMTDNGKWVKYQGGVNSVEPTNESVLNNFGSEISLGSKLYERLGIPIYYIKSGNGGTDLESNPQPDWSPDNANEEFDITTQRFFTPAIAKLTTEYPGKPIKIVLLWHQGESDAAVEAWRNAYATNFLAFVTELRAYDVSLTTVPLIAIKIYNNIGANEDVINAALAGYGGANYYLLDVASQCTYPRKQDLPADIKAAYPPTGSDDIHNSIEFQIKKGEMIFNKLVEIAYI